MLVTARILEISRNPFGKQIRIVQIVASGLLFLLQARKTEDDTPILYHFIAMAYGQIGYIPRADLATAEAAYARGDKKLAEEKAKVAMATLKRGSPDWLRANDILNFVNRE